MVAEGVVEGGAACQKVVMMTFSVTLSHITTPNQVKPEICSSAAC